MEWDEMTTWMGITTGDVKGWYHDMEWDGMTTRDGNYDMERELVQVME